MTLAQVRSAAAMIIDGHPEKDIIHRLGVTAQQLRRDRNAILFEIGLRRGGIVSISSVNRVA